MSTVSFKIETITFHNPTEHTIRLDAVGLDPVAPKSDVEVPIHLAAPTRMDNGTRGKSPLEQVAPQLHPKDAKDHEIWKRIPEPPIPQSKIVSVTPRAPSEAPGVKTLRELKAQVEAQKTAVASSPSAVSTPATK